MRSKYFTFLYNECKRSSKLPVDSNEIMQFINSPEGERGFRIFCAQKIINTEQPRPKHSREILKLNLTTNLVKGLYHE